MTLLYTIKTLDLEFSLSQGQFIEIFNLFESLQTTDAQVLAFFKTLTDSSIAADAAVVSFATNRADTTTTTDEKILSVFKTLVDVASVTDSLVSQLTFNRSYADAASAVDAQLNHLNKRAVDTVNATDDLDGEGSVLDDQEMQFVKVRSDTAAATDSLVSHLTFNRAYADAASTVDLASLAAEKFFSDVGGISDAVLVSRGKGLSSSAGATDTFVRQSVFSRSFTEAPLVADTFVHQSGFSRPFTETPSVNDLPELQLSATRSDSASLTDSILVLRTVNQTHSETPSATDAGSLRSQGYADFTYFAEDFVGASRTFT